jgi:CubicO group peptidase (beta-lactamase class C family)
MVKFLIVFLFIIYLITIDVSFQEPLQANIPFPKYKENLLFNNTRDEELKKLIDEYFKKLCTTYKFNGAILVASKGKILYENTFGYSNFKNKDTLNSNTLFQIGSVSKQFTAVAILMLKERGLIDYNDTVQKFFPKFPYKDVTIKHLLSHRSGIPDYIIFCDQFCNQHTYISNMDVMKVMEERHPPVYAKPDKTFYYNNTNYLVLAAIVEQITGIPFRDFADQQIFKPLGMKSTFIFNPFIAQDSTSINMATGYEYGLKETPRIYFDGVTGDKGIYSTLDDLYKWDQALYSEKLVSVQTLTEAFQPANPDSHGNRNYGYGWRLYKNPDGTYVPYHGGWWRGFNSLFLRDIYNMNTVIILSNKKSAHMNQAMDILKILNITGDLVFN